MKSTKPKGSLLVKQQTADIISLIVLEFKDKFKNIDLNDLKKDYHYIQLLMESIEKKFNDKSLFDAKNLDKIDKNDILIQLIKGIFPNMTKDEIDTIENVVNLIAGNQLVTKSENYIYKCLKFFFKM